MILVDTSVWIEFLKQNPAFVEALKPLLAAQRVVAIEPVFAELLYGARDRTEKAIILSYWDILPVMEFGEGSLMDAADFASSNDYLNKGIGLMDTIILRSVINGQYKLWTLDKRILSNAELQYLFQP